MRRLILLAAVIALSGCGAATSSTAAAPPATPTAAGISVTGDGYTVVIPAGWSHIIPTEPQAKGFAQLESSSVPLQWNPDGSNTGPVPADAQEFSVADGPLALLAGHVNGDPATIPLDQLATQVNGVEKGTTNIQALPMESADVRLDGEDGFRYAYTATYQGRTSTDVIIEARHNAHFFSVDVNAPTPDGARALLVQITNTWHWMA